MHQSTHTHTHTHTTQNEWDNIINLGRACSSSFFLKIFGRRLESQPFDWVTTSGKISNVEVFKKRCEILTDEFKDFLNPEFLKTTSKNPLDGFTNFKTGITFPHEEGYDNLEFAPGSLEKIQKKYERRIKRVLNYLKDKKASSLLFYVGIEQSEPEADVIIESFNKVKAHFKNENLGLYYMYADPNNDKDPVVKYHSDNITIISTPVAIQNITNIYLNLGVCSSFADRYATLKPRMNFLQKIIYSIQMLSINLILDKARRKNARKRLKQKYLCKSRIF